MLPDPFRGCGVEEKDTVKDASHPSGCGFYFYGAGFYEACCQGFETEVVSWNTFGQEKGAYSAILEDIEMFELLRNLFCVLNR